MINYKLLPLVTIAVLATGCASTSVTTKNNEPTVNKNDLVGMSVKSQLAETKKSLDDQLDLLKAVNSGQKITSYNLVTHNNNVDARVGSTNTLPIQYGQQDVPVPVPDVKVVEKKVVVTEDVKVSTTKTEVSDTKTIMNQKVKRIIWNNDSLNTLAKNLAKSIGFEFVSKASPTGISDANVNYHIENVTVREAIKELAEKAAPYADVLVVEGNKTVNVLYK